MVSGASTAGPRNYNRAMDRRFRIVKTGQVVGFRAFSRLKKLPAALRVCALCGVHLGEQATLEHINPKGRPRSAFGQMLSEYGNTRYICQGSNEALGDRSPEVKVAMVHSARYAVNVGCLSDRLKIMARRQVPKETGRLTIDALDRAFRFSSPAGIVDRLIAIGLVEELKGGALVAQHKREARAREQRRQYDEMQAQAFSYGYGGPEDEKDPGPWTDKELFQLHNAFVRNREDLDAAIWEVVKHGRRSPNVVRKKLVKLGYITADLAGLRYA